MTRLISEICTDITMPYIHVNQIKSHKSDFWRDTSGIGSIIARHTSIVSVGIRAAVLNQCKKFRFLIQPFVLHWHTWIGKNKIYGNGFHHWPIKFLSFDNVSNQHRRKRPEPYSISVLNIIQLDTRLRKQTVRPTNIVLYSYGM